VLIAYGAPVERRRPQRVNEDLLRQTAAATEIQKQWRAGQAREQYARIWWSSCMIHAWWIQCLARKQQQQASVRVQRAWRSHRARMRNQQQAAVRVQRAWRSHAAIQAQRRSDRARDERRRKSAAARGKLPVEESITPPYSPTINNSRPALDPDGVNLGRAGLDGTSVLIAGGAPVERRRSGGSGAARSIRLPTIPAAASYHDSSSSDGSNSADARKPAQERILPSFGSSARRKNDNGENTMNEESRKSGTYRDHQQTSERRDERKTREPSAINNESYEQIDFDVTVLSLAHPADSSTSPGAGARSSFSGTAAAPPLLHSIGEKKRRTATPSNIRRGIEGMDDADLQRSSPNILYRPRDDEPRAPKPPPPQPPHSPILAYPNLQQQVYTPTFKDQAQSIRRNVPGKVKKRGSRPPTNQPDASSSQSSAAVEQQPAVVPAKPREDDSLLLQNHGNSFVVPSQGCGPCCIQ